MKRRVAIAVQNKAGVWKIHWMDVTPHDGLTRFHVETVRAGSKAYLVDLESYWDNGCCGCMAFATGIEPVVSRWSPSERKPGDEFRCRHIRAARQFLAEELLNGFLHKKRTRKL